MQYTASPFSPPFPSPAVSVSRGFLTEFTVEADDSTKEQLVVFMGQIHGIVVDVCEEYFGSNRRHVYQTPKSFLSFLTKYKQLYAQKLAEVRTKEERVNMGLKKLVQGAADVDAMKGAWEGRRARRGSSSHTRSLPSRSRPRRGDEEACQGHGGDEQDACVARGLGRRG